MRELLRKADERTRTESSWAGGRRGQGESEQPGAAARRLGHQHGARRHGDDTPRPRHPDLLAQPALAVDHVVAATGIDRARGSSPARLRRRRPASPASNGGLTARERQLLGGACGARAETGAGRARGRSGSPRARGRAAARPGSTCRSGSRQSTRFSVHPRHPERSVRPRAPLVRPAEHPPLEPAARVARSPRRCRAARAGRACRPGRARARPDHDGRVAVALPVGPRRRAQLEVEAAGAVAVSWQHAAQRVGAGVAPAKRPSSVQREICRRPQSPT